MGESGKAGTTDGAMGGTSGAGTNTAGTSGMSGMSGMSGAPDAAGSSGHPASTRVPWDEAHCVEALSAGTDGDPCADDFKCTATTDCCQIIGYCAGKTLSIQRTCNLCIKTCTTDADCGSGKLCDNYECHDCSSEACPDTWSTIIRSDCKVCVPPNECKDAAGTGCPDNEVCIAGLTCLSGCKGDPACCYGNRCAAKECSPPNNVDCLLVGCAAGTSCKVAGPAADCACDPKLGKWSCTPTPLNLCAPK